MSDAETKGKDPIVIKKYANRRLYNTATSTYVTLEDLSTMVRASQDFVVFDAKTGEDITRSVLTQIIFEEENKGAQNLLPINFMRQLIRFYGDTMQPMVPGYLEMSMDGLMKEQEKFKKQMADAMGSVGIPGMPQVNLPGVPADVLKTMEEQTRKNLTLFQDAMKSFNPFLASMSTGMGAGMGTSAPKPAAEKPSAATSPKPDDFQSLKEQLAAMQEKLETLSQK